MDGGTAIDLSEWADVDVTNAGHMPMQTNEHDCGLSHSFFVDYFSTPDRMIDWDQADMCYFRKRVVLEITQCALLDGIGAMHG